MTSNLFSGFGKPTRAGRSFYEELRTRDDDDGPRHRDVEERAGLALDEENLNQQFHDDDLEQAERLGFAADDGDADDVPGSLLVEAHGADPTTIPEMFQAPPPLQSNLPNRGPGARKGAGVAKRARVWEAAQGPSSHRSHQYPPNRQQHKQHQQNQQRPQRFRESPARTDVHGQLRASATDASPAGAGNALLSYFRTTGARGRNPHDLAMWRWANVTNLDNYIRDVYDYHRACGLRCILVERFLHLVNVAFVALFLTFLTQCIDYSKIRGSTKMSQILVPQCTSNMSWVWNLGLWLFAFYFIWKTMQFFVFDLYRLFHLRDFFVYLLQIPEHDMQTVSWQDVVVKIMALRDQNPKTASNMTRLQREWIGSQSKERLDAHDIANRLMRRENYLIALFNKDILNLTIPLPLFRNTQLLTRTLEWTLWFAVLDFVFDDSGQVNQEFLKASRRSQLSQKLKSRFLFAGFMNLLLAPFVACYLIVVYFLTYYNEYQKNPSALGARAYTPLAEWKFREFNELEHLFEQRLNMSYPFATRYLEQFPKRKTEQVARTVAFIAGSVMTVLAIASLIDPELFLGFEITHDRTVLFYVGIFATVWATARGMITEENSVFDPEYALRNVIEYTHYEPDHWRGRLHSNDVKMEFSGLYQNKIRIFVEEVLSILVTPLILFASLPLCSDQIVDFFREFTIHVDGLGYVCSFAVFDFKEMGGVNGGRRAPTAAGAPGKPGAPVPSTTPADPSTFPLPQHEQNQAGTIGDVREDYYATKHGKMAASYYGFLDNYVINPKTGIPGHHPTQGLPHPFHHAPPAFPGLNTLRAPRFGPGGGGGMGMASPMASILLDPHHQPSASAFANRSTYQRGFAGERGRAPMASMLESAEDANDHDADAATETDVPDYDRPSHSEEYQGGNGLDESMWQTSPPKGPSRETSGVGEESDVGVLGLMYQFQQAHMAHRPGGRGA